MAWLTAAEFRAIYVTDSATEVKPEQLGQCLDEAIDELTTLCGDEAASVVSSATDNTPLKIKQFRRAQGKLAFRELLLIMSSRFRSGGIVVTERDENAVATNQYESFEKTEQRRAALYAEALRIVGRYLTQTNGDEAAGGAGSIELSHPAAVQTDECCDLNRIGIY